MMLELGIHICQSTSVSLLKLSNNSSKLPLKEDTFIARHRDGALSIFPSRESNRYRRSASTRWHACSASPWTAASAAIYHNYSPKIHHTNPNHTFLRTLVFTVLHLQCKAAIEDCHTHFQISPRRVEVEVKGPNGGKDPVHTHVLGMPGRRIHRAFFGDNDKD